MKYLYCKDEVYSKFLISKNAKLINTMNLNNEKVWIFEYTPDLFNLEFDKSKCSISNKLMMLF